VKNARRTPEQSGTTQGGGAREMNRAASGRIGIKEYEEEKIDGGKEKKTCSYQLARIARIVAKRRRKRYGQGSETTG